MSRFYTSSYVDDDRTSSSRRSHRNVLTHTRGWNVGAEVQVLPTMLNQDVVYVRVTEGSNGSSTQGRLVFTCTDCDGKRYMTIHHPIDYTIVLWEGYLDD